MLFFEGGKRNRRMGLRTESPRAIQKDSGEERSRESGAGFNRLTLPGAKTSRHGEGDIGTFVCAMAHHAIARHGVADELLRGVDWLDY